ncbi:MAG TPA: ABC transporter permease [Bacilli bacterium]|nr:ABC transporter permease [Bacilli bacterium]
MNKAFTKMATPYLVWLSILAVFPVFMMLVLIFLDVPGIKFGQAVFSLKNFAFLKEPSTLQAFGNSFKFAFLTMAICWVLGYLVAYQIFRSKFKNKFLILTILILPMWSNILLRNEALRNMLEPNNMIQDLLSRINIDLSVNIYALDFGNKEGHQLAVLLGLVITYLPFMILPIYTALEKIDYSLEEAAVDLGANDFQKFWRVIFPLSLKGVITGSIMVFLPSMSGFAIPLILGKGNIVLVGNLIEQSFLHTHYNLGSLLAIILLVLILHYLYLINY